MKKFYMFMLFACYHITNASAQTWNTTGNAGLTTSSFLGSTNNKDIIFKASNKERGRLAAQGFWRFGTATNYTKIDSSGKLTFAGNGVYQVAGNKYVFQNISNPNYGLYYNSSIPRYEFRNGSATPVFYVDANNGSGTFTGTLKIGAYTLPSADGANGQVLTTNGAGIISWKTVSGSGVGANTSLSNLTTPTSLNVGLTPDKTNNLNIGSVAKSWKDVYLAGKLYIDGQPFLDNTGAANTFIGITGTTANSGIYNTFTGASAGFHNTTGGGNSFYGATSGQANTTGNGNSFFGAYAGTANTSGFSNTFSGYQAGFSNTTANSNTANGYNALYSNATGNGNIATGYNTLYHNTSGYSNVATGAAALNNNTVGNNMVAIGDSALFNQSTNANGWYYNTAVGSKALFANTVGAGNTALGYQSLYLNKTGIDNTASGVAAMYNNLTGGFNTAYGSHNLSTNSSGSFNTSTGYAALYNNTSGNNNTANGYNALAGNTTGYSNVAIGVSALYKNTEGFNLIAIGDSALFNQAVDPTKIYSNTAVGSKALYANTTGRNNTAIGWGACNAGNGSDNTGIGNAALYKNLSGYNNTATGSHSMENNTSGYLNTSVGTFSLTTNNTGYYNTAVGAYALQYNTSGFDNTAFGVGTLADNITGTENTAVGGYAMVGNKTGKSNTAIGAKALNADSIGSGNTAVGDEAGLSLKKESNNTIVGAFTGNEHATSNATLIGYDADPNGNYSNISALGYQAMNTANNQVMLGNTSVTSVKAAGSFVIYSDGRYKKDLKENVPGLAFIKQLKPVTYHYDIYGMNKFMGIKQADKNSLQQEGQAITDKERKLYTGFVAQDVEAVAKKLNYDFSGIYHPQNDKDLYGLSYADFVVPLVKAVQELSKINDDKNAAIDSLQKQNADLQKQFNDLKKLVLQIQQMQQQCSPCSVASSNAGQQYLKLADAASLEQNIPNPFTNTTTIGYSLPQKFSSAQIIITDKNGRQLKQIKLSNAGKGTANVDASMLASGAYYYSLYVDGRLIASKQMEHLK